MKRSLLNLGVGFLILVGIVVPPVLACGGLIPLERHVAVLGWATPTQTPKPDDLGPTGGTAGQTTPPEMIFDGTRPVRVPSGWVAWALVDLRTGQKFGSQNAGTASLSASMIKAWLAADFLRMKFEAQTVPTERELATMETMIRDSSNGAAGTVYSWLGGSVTLTRMKTLCALEGKPYVSGSKGWGSTYISARDAADMGACIASGKIAGPWTYWLLDMMRQVRGAGDFGIRTVLSSPETVAIKNGWVPVGSWYVNCLAIGDTWSLAVMTRVGSFGTGVQACESVTTQLLKNGESK